MAGDAYVAISEAVYVATSALVTLNLQTGASRRINVNEISVTFNGTTASQVPSTVRLVRTSGNPSGTALTSGPNPSDNYGPSSITSGLQPSTASPGAWTTPPTVGVYLRSWYVPSTSGLILQFPLGLEIDTKVSDGIGIQVTAAATVQCTTYLQWIE